MEVVRSSPHARGPFPAILATKAPALIGVCVVRTVIGQVKGTIIILKCLQLLCIFSQIVHTESRILAPGLGRDAGVHITYFQLSQLADNALTAYIDVLGISTAGTCDIIGTHIQRETRGAGISAGELGVSFSDYRLRLSNAQTSLPLRSTCTIIYIDGIVVSRCLHRTFAVGIIEIVADITSIRCCQQAVLLIPAVSPLPAMPVRHTILLHACRIDMDEVSVGIILPSCLSYAVAKQCEVHRLPLVLANRLRL